MVLVRKAKKFLNDGQSCAVLQNGWVMTSSSYQRITALAAFYGSIMEGVCKR